jgi:hypothetical protein
MDWGVEERHAAKNKRTDKCECAEVSAYVGEPTNAWIRVGILCRTHNLGVTYRPWGTCSYLLSPVTESAARKVE